MFSQKSFWHYLSVFAIIFMISYSFVTILDTSSLDATTSDSNQDYLVFSLKLGLSYGTQPLIDIGLLSHSGSSTVGSITSIVRQDQSTLNLDTFFGPFDFFNEISCLIVGTLSHQLYKLLQYSKEKKDWGNNKSLVKTTITLNPGISLRGLSRASGLAMGSTQYWVRILAQENEIEQVSLGKSNHYFARDLEYTTNEKLLYSLLQNKRINEILRVLSTSPTVRTQKALCSELGYNKSLLSYYIKILKNHNIVESRIQELSISKDFKIHLDN
jgi:hypothetical protein